MVTLFRTMKSLSLGGIASIVRVKSDGVRLYVTVGPKVRTVPSGSTVMSYTVTYGGETRSVSFVSGEMEFRFDYTGEKTVVIGGIDVYVDGAYQVSYTATWTAEPSEMLDVTADISYSFNSIKANTESNMTVSLPSPDGVYMKIISFGYTLCDEWETSFENADCSYTKVSGTYRYTNSMSSSLCMAKSKIQYRVEAAYYASEAASRVNDGESFIGYADILTPMFIIAASSDQSVPFSLEYPSPVSGAPLQVKWKGHADSLVFFLERSVNGGAFTSVYTGGTPSFTDTVASTWSTVRYRVGSAGSIWWTGDSVSVINTNIFIGTPDGIRSATGMYIGGGAVRSTAPIMSVGGM